MPFPSDKHTMSPSASAVSALARAHCWQVLVAIVAFRVLAAATFPVFYKEAYFWDWSRFPSLGYLDHPPMVAWVIKAFTLWLPDRWPLTIRCGGVLFGAAALALVYRVAWQLFGDRAVAAQALVLASSVPLLHAVGVLMLPDAPLVFFHLLAVSWFVSALRSGRVRAWCLSGAAMGLALLSKLMAVPALLGLGLFLVCSREHRFWLTRKEPYLALAVAALVCSPFLYWNLQHDWASFALQLRDRHRATFGFGIGKAAEFGFEQLVNTLFLSVPLLACLFARSHGLPDAWRPGYRLLRWQSLTTLGFFLLTGAVTETHPHWTVLAYPAAAIALAAWWSSQPARGLARSLDWLVPLALATSLLVLGLVPLARPILMNIPADSLGERWAKKIDTARVRLFGWPDLVAQLEGRLRQVAAAADARDGVVFGDSYRQASLLSFHRDGGLVVNLEAYRRVPRNVGDAAWYYLPPQALQGASGIFVTGSSGISPNDLRRVFRDVTPLAGIEKHAAGQGVGRSYVFRVEGFRAAVAP